MLATLSALLTQLMSQQPDAGRRARSRPPPPDKGCGFPVSATLEDRSADSGGSTLIAKHAAVIGLCILAVVIPAIPGIEGLAPGPARSIRTETGSESFLSAPSCSETRADLCLSSTATPAPSQTALREVEPASSPQPVVAEADATARLRAPEPTPEPEPWGAIAVRPGDTLIALANWFGVSPFDIAVVNGAAVDDYLVIGETLVIPVPESQFVIPPVPDISEPAGAPVAVTPAPAPEPASEPAPPPVVIAPPELPASSGQTWTKDDAVEAICSLPWPCETMVAIAACESGLRANAVNPAGYYGLFQINHAFDGWDNPWTNAQVAYNEKYLPMLESGGDGLAPWPVCRYY